MLGINGLERGVIDIWVVVSVFTRKPSPPPKKKAKTEQNKIKTYGLLLKRVGEHYKLMPHIVYLWDKIKKKEEECLQAGLVPSILEKEIFSHSHSDTKVVKSNVLTIALRLRPNNGRIKD